MGVFPFRALARGIELAIRWAVSVSRDDPLEQAFVEDTPALADALEHLSLLVRRQDDLVPFGGGAHVLTLTWKGPILRCAGLFSSLAVEIGEARL
jgi:hypothetical protein